MNTQNVEWTNNLENYFKEIGEKSLCLSILHKNSENKYSKKAQYIDLPVIIFSTICGSLSLSAKSLFGVANEQIAMTGVGVLSLFTGVLGTIQAYFMFNRRAENHRNSYLEYSKLYRFCKVELGLPREQRITAKDLLKIINDQFERLNELSPMIPTDVISSFKPKLKKYPDVSVPEIANGLEAIAIFSPRQTILTKKLAILKEDEEKKEEFDDLEVV